MSEADNKAAPTIETSDETVKTEQAATPPRTEEEEKQDRDYWEAFWQDAENKELLTHRKRIDEFLRALEQARGEKLAPLKQTGDKAKDQTAFSSYYKSTLHAALLVDVKTTKDKESVFAINGKADRQVVAQPTRIAFTTTNPAGTKAIFDDEAAFAMALLAMKMGLKNIQFKGDKEQRQKLREAVIAVNALYPSESRMVPPKPEKSGWRPNFFGGNKTEPAPAREEIEKKYGTYASAANKWTRQPAGESSQPPTNTNPNPPSPTPEQQKASPAKYKHDDTFQVRNAAASKAEKTSDKAPINLSDEADTLENAIQKDASREASERNSENNTLDKRKGSNKTATDTVHHGHVVSSMSSSECMHDLSCAKVDTHSLKAFSSKTNEQIKPVDISSADLADIENLDLPAVDGHPGPAAVNDDTFPANNAAALEEEREAPAPSTNSTTEALREEREARPVLKTKPVSPPVLSTRKTSDAPERGTIENKLTITNEQAKSLVEQLSPGLVKTYVMGAMTLSLGRKFNELAKPIQNVVKGSFKFTKHAPASMRDGIVSDYWNKAGEKQRITLIQAGLTKTLG